MGKIQRAVMLCLILLLLLAFLVSSVFAGGYQHVNVLVAFDEEWISIADWLYSYNPEELAEIIILEVNFHFYQFDIEFIPVTYVYWNSYDNPTDPCEMIEEVVDETGFVSGEGADVLIAFTDQDMPMVYGKANSSLGVVMAEEMYINGLGQVTDNILQHELTHLYGLDDHYVEGLDCVMNIYHIWLGPPWFKWVRTALTTNNWCEDCANIIYENRGYWGVWVPLGGGGTGHALREAW